MAINRFKYELQQIDEVFLRPPTPPTQEQLADFQEHRDRYEDELATQIVRTLVEEGSDKIMLTGPMYAGKSSVLNRIHPLLVGQGYTPILASALDKGHESRVPGLIAQQIVHRIPTSPRQIPYEFLEKTLQHQTIARPILLLDEATFLHPDTLVILLKELTRNKIPLICAGLDYDIYLQPLDAYMVLKQKGLNEFKLRALTVDDIAAQNPVGSAQYTTRFHNGRYDLAGPLVTVRGTEGIDYYATTREAHPLFHLAARASNLTDYIIANRFKNRGSNEALHALISSTEEG